MLSAREAADYCGLPLKKFSTGCPVNAVMLPGGDERFDMRDLDNWLDGLKAGSSSDFDDIIERLGK